MPEIKDKNHNQTLSVTVSAMKIHGLFDLKKSHEVASLIDLQGILDTIYLP